MIVVDSRTVTGEFAETTGGLPRSRDGRARSSGVFTSPAENYRWGPSAKARPIRFQNVGGGTKKIFWDARA